MSRRMTISMLHAQEMPLQTIRFMLVRFTWSCPFNCDSIIFCSLSRPRSYTVQTCSKDLFGSVLLEFVLITRLPLPLYVARTYGSTSCSRRRSWSTPRRARRAREKRRPPCTSAPPRYSDNWVYMFRVLFVNCTYGLKMSPMMTYRTRVWRLL